MKVIVIGAGVGGTTASLALLGRGFEVELYEQAPKLLPLGAGLSLWGNAVACLDEVGLGDAVLAAGTIVESAEIRARSGRVLSRAAMKPLADRLGRPTVAIRRGVLHDILVSALPNGVLRLGHELETFSQDDGRVSVRFANGHEARGDVLVGADGLRSKVRQALLSDGPPTYSGYRGWLGLVPFGSPSLPPGAVIESWGRGERFGALHCGGGEVYWFAAANRAEPIPNVRPARKQDVLDLVRGWHEPFPTLIEATEEARIVELSFWDRDPVPKWGTGRVTLLGDAAHPMTPNIGQGACQAIEDGLALASQLAATKLPERSLRSYEAQRSARTARFVLRSRRFGRLVQRPGVLSTWLRDTLVRLTPPHVQLNQMAKLFERPAEGSGSREASGIELMSSRNLTSSATSRSKP